MFVHPSYASFLEQAETRGEEKSTASVPQKEEIKKSLTLMGFDDSMSSYAISRTQSLEEAVEFLIRTTSIAQNFSGNSKSGRRHKKRRERRIDEEEDDGMDIPPIEDVMGHDDDEDGDGVIKCRCGEKAFIKTAKTEKNFGRKFFSCRYYPKPKACGFFKWCDD